MTVKELIEKLKTVDGDLPVRIGSACSAYGLPEGNGDPNVFALLYEKPKELGGDFLMLYTRVTR